MLDRLAASANDHRSAGSVARKPGTLVILGSGIKAISQFTLEAEHFLDWAEAVFFCVADPATERWILDKKPDAIDLYQYYGNDKQRSDTYVQMAEIMLNAVRQALNVVGIFYGHPGVFVSPSHRAIAIARSEGHQAFMLPSISALDCLFADLGIDPSLPGCQIYEATDLLVRQRPLVTDGHVIIFQPGSVGNPGFNFDGFPNTHLSVLIRYLQAAYGDDHDVVNYSASQYAMCDPVIQRTTLSALLTPEGAKAVTGISTFYLPPKSERAVDPDVLATLGLIPQAAVPQLRAISQQEIARRAPAYSKSSYTPRELSAVAQLETHCPPPEYKPTRVSSEMYRAVQELSLSPVRLAQLRSAPEDFLRHYPGLTANERVALIAHHAGLLRRVMRRSTLEVADAFVRQLIADPMLSPIRGFVSGHDLFERWQSCRSGCTSISRTRHNST